jgi:hypothetical protein
MQPKASQVLIRVLRKDRTKDPSRRRKGQPISLASSAIAIVRKAITRTNTTPGSSVMNCKDLDIATTAISMLLRAIEN